MFLDVSQSTMPPNPLRSMATKKELLGGIKAFSINDEVNVLPSSDSSVDMLVDHLGILGMCWRSSDRRCKALCLALRSVFNISQ